LDSNTHRSAKLEPRWRQTLLLVPAAAAGLLLATEPRRAEALAPQLPPAPVQTPQLPVTVPDLPSLPLPSTTPATTTPTTPPATPPAPATQTPAAATAAPAATTADGAGAASATVHGERAQTPARALPATPAGAVRIGKIRISIPVASVRAPARLRLAATLSPRVVQKPSEPIRASVLVRDTRGYLVRGARIAVSAVPDERIVRVADRLSGTNGRAVVVVRLRRASFRPGPVQLLVTASDPAAPKAAAARLRLSVVLEPPR